MENIDYRVLIERMGPEENVIGHLGNGRLALSFQGTANQLSGS